MEIIVNRDFKILSCASVSLFACLCCLCATGGGAFAAYSALHPNSTVAFPPKETAFVSPTVTDTLSPTGNTFTPASPDTSLDLSDPATQNAYDELARLQQADPPAGDLVEQAERLKGIKNIPRVVTENAAPVAVGAKASFNITNMDNNANLTITAEMRYATPHSYFWLGKGATADDADIRALMDTFEESIYPTDREFFGSEWTPGVDGDVHLNILYARRLGMGVAGYYSPADEVSRMAHPLSNEHEMFYLNADTVGLTEDYAYSVLAHEFQHMIHWYGDSNEDGWVNEGFAELAVILNGYDLGGLDWAYSSDTDIQLNTWSDINDSESPSHYGASSLFMDYFLGRFGPEVTQAVVRNPKNGWDGVEDTFRTMGITDPTDGHILTAADVMADFSAAFLLQDSSVGSGQYGFREYLGLPQPKPAEEIPSCPTEKLMRTVSQFGIDYISIPCTGSMRIQFSGDTLQKVLPVDSQAGKYYAWSNRGDQSDMTLTREFDLSAATSATLQFDLWYDLEEEFDYAYVEASTDGGATWTILPTVSGTDLNPQGNNLGWGWNGESGGRQAQWIQEQADLSRYAGSRVWIRFEYITDAAVNGEGLLVDNIRIPEISSASDFEDGLDGWDSQGFVRLQNALPQTFRVLLIRRGANTAVEEMALDNRNFGELTITPGQNEEIYLVVIGTTRYTLQKAPYQFIILP
jgi:immune inhibitor A